jgi:alpha-L-rhamnosidase
MRPLLPLVFALLLPMAASAAPAPPSGLRCEYLTDPIGVDVANPRFFWLLDNSARGSRQTAYQVLVSTEPAASKGDQWDSGKVESAEFTHIVFGGKPLHSDKTYYWKVRYWDGNGDASLYSSIARFDTGLFSPSDWKAQWIRGGNQLRKEYSLPAKVRRARAYVAGIGYYELRINGEKVGDHVLDPGTTAYDKRVLYAAYDVTDRLRQGSNAVGIMLGEGWYHARAAILQIAVETADGKSLVLATDGSWKATQGPILADSIYNGELYDARQETPGWDLPGYDDRAWKPVTLNDAPKGVLSAQLMPPIRVVAGIVPLRMTNPRPGVFVYDMGQNFSGWVRLRVRGPVGATVRLRYAELLYDDGTLNVDNLRKARATDTYTLRGAQEGEVYEPRFTYHGFRYVEVTGFPGVPRADSVLGRVVHSDVTPIGGFASSKDLLNQIQRLAVWSTRTNLHSIPTDSDQRDERMGWMGDAHVAAETAMVNYDVAAFYTNFLRSIRDSQNETGAVTDMVPPARYAPADPAWGSAYPLLVLYMYHQYGDRRILEQHFDGIRAWAEFLRSKSVNGTLDYVKYGDWVSIEPTPGNLVSSAYYFWSVDIVAKTAAILGKNAEAERYRKLADEVAAAFQTRFYHAEDRTYGNGSQTSLTLPLFLGITPPALQRPVYGNLRDQIIGRDTHLSTGILGTKYLLPTLTQAGGSDLAYDLATQTTYPSWGYMIANGATTVWELWQNRTGPTMNSHNHPMLGSVGAWLYTALAGINPDAKSPGYGRIRIQPQMVRDLRWASGSIETIRGTVSSSWSREPDSVKLDVTIPAGSTAEVHLPKFNLSDIVILEGNQAVWRTGAFVAGAPGVSGARDAGIDIVLETVSGTYSFELKGR